MIQARFWRAWLVAGVAWTLFVSTASLAQAQAKFIRLRNQTISTPVPPAAALRLQAPLLPAQGLYLLQFDASPDGPQRTELAQRGVRLVRYVPDDTFIAQFDHVDLNALRAVPGVRWVGEYQPDWKVARALRELAAHGEAADVGMMVSPLATPAERVVLRRAMLRLVRESHSRFGSVYQGRVSPAQLATLARSPLVLWIEPAPRPRLFDEISAKIVGGGSYETGEPGGGFPPVDGGGDDDEDFSVASVRLAAAATGRTPPILQGLPSTEHLSTVQALGFDGRGVVVAVADSGLNNGDAETMHPDLAGRVDAFLFYGNLTDAADEHSHGTHVSGIIGGNGATGETDEFNNLYGLGVAPGVHIVAQRIFDGVGGYEAPPTYETLTRDAVRAGAVVGSNSWGDDTQGQYDISAAEFDALVRDADELTPGEQPYILEFSAGNAGPGSQTIGSPAVAKNVIASGASDNDRYGFFLFEDGPEAMADFSSRGPCADGRIKPDVVAPGTWIASLQSQSATDENAWSPISANYQYQGGTSQSGPHVSGAAAILVQYWRDTHAGVTPSPALVKALLIDSATDMDDAAGGTAPVPNNDEGWGRVTLTNIIGSARKLDAVDQSISLTNRQVTERRVLVGGPAASLKVTLTYTDVPGLPAAVPALVNDLDLEVEAPDGTLYRGNAIADGESIPNALAADIINNVEGVRIATPQAGEYVVRVRASRVVEDIHRRSGVTPVQDFALVVSGELPLPGQGILVMDRPAYTIPATAQLKLIDFDLRGAAGVNVTVRSTTESAGEIIRLLPQGNLGAFTGAVALASGPAVADGRIQVANGDTLTATYQDADPAAVREATALIDNVPPVLTDFAAVTRFGRVQVTWTSDELADSIVDYGPTTALGTSVTNRILVDGHRLVLDGVPLQQKLYVRVRSRDAAGNERVLTNNGVPFEVTPAATAPILLVDAFADLLLGDVLQLSTYTDALDAVGVDYEIWDVASEGRGPTFEELRNYRVVIWRAGEFSNSLDATDVKAIRDYVDAGGGFFMASMELLSRLDEGGFTNFRKLVLHVEDYDVDPGVDGVFGSDSVSMTSAVDMPLDFSAFPDLIIISLNVSDTFRVTTNATPILFDANSGKPVGVRYPRTGEDGKGRVVFFSFPFDAIPEGEEAPNNRVEILRRVVGFLAPELSDTGSVELDREEYTVPALVAVEVADGSRVGQTSLTVRATTEHETNAAPVTLLATDRAGVFRGQLRLVPSTNAPASGEFRASDGDVLEITYRSTPTATPMSVAAVVDTGAPTITGVTIDPDYTEAIVRWTTSEPTDGLVKYRDVGFPSNFTAYHADFTETHELRLTGLEADQTYEFALVCRDPAGNTTTDDKQGKFYQFRTLKPLNPPFTDTLEQGDGAWTVESTSLGDDILSLLASSTWQLGKPANSLASAAHSGNGCWGTNLRGEVNDYAESQIVSPAILLSGGNRATLKFWHTYDFLPRDEESDITEVGGVYVSTNNGAVWTPLASYGEASGGWEQEEIDLSPYLGRIIRLAWAYGLFSFGSVEHPGWLVDDVAVTVTSFVPSTLILSNNLSQATVAVQGPLNRVERGVYTVVTNVPPGEYRFDFGDLPFFIRPEAQTRTITEGTTVQVNGTYTFTDTNHDGVSDPWELQFLGAVRPGHQFADDFDQDGFSDGAEFLMGTNPTNALSKLTLLPPQFPTAGQVALRWETVVGRSYRVLASTNAVAWAPATAWIRAASSAASANLSLTNTPAPYLFRLEALP